MELGLTENGKLRIVLTSYDMARYDIDIKTLDYGNTKTRKAVWNLLDMARERIGFDAAVGRIFIQVYPARSGGCEMYITKLGEVPAPNEIVNEPVCREKIPVKTVPKPAVYAFDSLEAMTAACRKLYDNAYRAESSAYSEKRCGLEPCYYLVLQEETGQSRAACECLLVGEYGTRLSCAQATPYLREHATLLCDKNAVKTLADL